MTIPKGAGSQATNADPFAGPPPAATHSGQVAFPGSKFAWTYLVSPSDMTCRLGEIVPVLRRATHAQGMQGNPKDLGRGEGSRAWLLGQGYVEVPHGMTVQAWGEERVGYMVRHTTETGEGRLVTTYTHAWRKPRRMGRLVVYDDDEEGYADFHRRCLALVTQGGELDKVQVDIAVAPLVRSCRNLADRGDSKGTRYLIARLAHLPYEHAPPDLQALMREHDLAPAPEPEPPKPKRAPRKRKPAAKAQTPGGATE